MQATRWTALRDERHCQMAHYGPLVCIHYRKPASASELHADFDAQEQVLREWGELTQVVVFDSASIGRLDSEARPVATERLRQWGPRMRCSALVLLGEGLGTRLMRVALMSISALSKAAERQRLFSTVEPAMEWARSWPRQHPLVASAPLEPLLTEFKLPAR